jgi:hypothetical protein
MEKNFYCENKFYESLMQSIPFFGQVMTFTILMFYQIKSH